VLNLMSDSNTGLYESSTLACVAISVIPIALYLIRRGTIFPPDWRVTMFGAALCFACLLIPVGTEARTGLICIAALGVMMLRATKRRFLYLFAAGALGLAAIPFLPDSFTKRMDTLNEVNTDESASTRLAVWKWTLDYVGDHPLGGGFDSYRGNAFRYEARTSAKFDPNAPRPAGAPTTMIIVDKGRAFHSAYFEMLGEQGWPGLGIWLFIHLSGLLRMELLFRRFGKRGPEDGQWIGGLATALQQANIIYLIGAAFIGVAFLPFAYMLIAMQIALDAYARRFEREKTRKPFFTAKAVPA
jgi:O-antigen ligase